MTDVVEDNTPIDEAVFEDVSTVKESELTQEVKSDTPSVPTEEVKGYRTYDQWVTEGKDPDEYKGKKAYEREGERFKSLMALQAEQKSQREAMQKMWEYNKRIEEQAKKTALEELKVQTMQATSIGDVARVSELTDKMLKMNETVPMEQPVVQHVTPSVDPRERFSQMNPWYKNPQSETDYARIGFAEQAADTILAEHQARGVNLTMEQHLQLVTERVANKFPTQPAKRVDVISATGEASGHPSESRALIDKLPQFHKNMVRSLQQAHKAAGKPFTNADLNRYITQVKQLGEM
jgi:hypothetical protein